MSPALPDPSNVIPALPAGLLEEAIALLRRLTEQTSASGDPEGLRQMAALLVRELEARGLAAAIRDEPDADGRPLPVVEARAGALRGSGSPLLLVGHFDTVLDAAPPRRDGDRLLATGAIDMKGGIAAFLSAVDLVRLRGAEIPAFRLLLVPDEEVGGEISRRAVATAGENASALWVLEPGERRGAGETLVTGRRGMFPWTLRVRGRGAHSGLAFWQGRSAALAAAEWATRAGALSVRGPGPTVNVARLLAGEQGLIAAFAAAPEAPRRHEALAGGFGSAHLLNVVPDGAIVEGEVRFLRNAEAEGLAGALSDLASEVARRHEVAVEFGRGESVSAVGAAGDGSPAREPADRAVALAAAAGWELTREEDRGGISFPNFLPDPERIPVLDGLGPVGGGMHTREEFVELVSLARRIRLLADLLAAEASIQAHRRA